MEAQIKKLVWFLLLVCCLPWAAQATTIPPPNAGAFQAPLFMAQDPTDSGLWVAVDAGELPNVYVQRLTANGDTVFTNHRFPANEKQVGLDLQISNQGFPLLLIQQETYFPPFANFVELHRLGADGEPIWTTTIVSSEEFSLGAEEFRLSPFGDEVLITWLDNSTDFVQGQWVSLTDGQLVGDHFVIIPTFAYSYDVAVDDTMIVVTAANTVATIGNSSAQLVLHYLQASYHPLTITCLPGGVQVWGVNNDLLYLEFFHWEGFSDYVTIDQIGQNVLPREVNVNNTWFSYRASLDTIKGLPVDGESVVLGYGNGVHYHQLASGSQGSSCLWRNAERNEVYGQQLSQAGPMWNEGGSFVASLIDFGGRVPFAACNGGEFGYLAALTSDYNLLVMPIDRNTPVNPFTPPAVVRELVVEAFPNPFNSTVNLVWQVTGQVEITIFSVLGQVVAHQQLVGEQQFFWQPNGLASGRYYVHVNHQSGQAEVPLVYLK